MKQTELILIILAILGFVLKILLIAGGGFLMMLSLSVLAVYYLVNIAGENNLSFSSLFGREFYSNRKNHFLSIITGVAFCIAIISILFRLQFYPGAYYLEICALLLLGIVQVLLNNLRQTSPELNLKAKFRKAAIFGAIIMVMLLLPSRRMFAFFHRNKPAYVEAVFNSWDHPGDKQLEEEIEKAYDVNRQTADDEKLSNGVYESKEVGWSISVSKEWPIIKINKKSVLFDKQKKAIEESFGQELDTSGYRHLIDFKKNKTNQLQSMIEPVQFNSSEMFEENNIKTKEQLCKTYMSYGLKADSSATTLEVVDGVEFHVFTITVYEAGQLPLSQMIYQSYINGYNFTVKINSDNEADKEKLLKAFRNSTFKKI